ncbi:hypothetical protein MMC13_007856 [Lambiella insularis]|nr:hypothetical protein [Lambiella insularis]
MSVEVCSTSGQILYCSGPGDSDKKGDPKVRVIYGEPSTTELQLMKKCFIIRSGELLIRTDARQEFADEYLFTYGRVAWASLLRDTFGKLMRDLVDGVLTTLCGTALGCAARIFTSIVTDEQDLPADAYSKYRQGWKHVNSSSHGRGFINTIRQYLPELADSERLMDAMELSSMSIDAVGRYEQAIHVIAAACTCSKCKHTLERGPVSGPPLNETFCQIILVEVISELVQNISSLSLPTTLYPARSGVEGIYWNRLEPDQKSDQDYVYRSLLRNRSRNILISAKDLFTGRTGRAVFRNQSAKADSGLCFVTDTLIDISANQEQCSHLHIIPGRIEWDGNVFDETIDLPREEVRPQGLQYGAISEIKVSSTSCTDLEDTSSPDIACDLVLEEFGGNHVKSL